MSDSQIGRIMKRKRLLRMVSGSRDSIVEMKGVCCRFVGTYSSFLRLPFGAGSRGVRVYVTVLVTTCLTLTGRWQPDRGGSRYRVFPSRIQSAGENGERIAPLFGELVDGENIGD